MSKYAPGYVLGAIASARRRDRNDLAMSTAFKPGDRLRHSKDSKGYCRIYLICRAVGVEKSEATLLYSTLDEIVCNHRMSQLLERVVHTVFDDDTIAWACQKILDYSKWCHQWE